MARKSFAELQLPTSGAQSVPYPTYRAVASKYLSHSTDSYVGEVTGAGGVGGSLRGIPFQPAIVDVYEPVAPLAQRQIPGSAGAIDINLITGAAAAAAIVVAVDDPTVPSWRVNLVAGIAVNGRVVHVVCQGFRDQGGSL